jgi:hypothetical protein
METFHQYLDWYCSKTLAHYLLAAYMVFLVSELIFGRCARASRMNVMFNGVYEQAASRIVHDPVTLGTRQPRADKNIRW